MTKGTLYNCAISNQGYLLAGTPLKPARIMRDAPKVGELPTNLDLSFSDASTWLPWAQTDWSGEFQVEKWEDTASFKSATNIDTQSKFGQLTLQPSVTTVKTDFASGHTFSSYYIANNLLFIGTAHASQCQIWKITSGDVPTNIGGLYAGWTSVNDFDLLGNKLLVAIGTSSAQGYGTTFLRVYNLLTEEWTYIPNVDTTQARMVKVIDTRIYLGQYTETGGGDKLSYTDDEGTTWNDIITDTGINKQIIKGAVNYGVLYFLIQDGHKLEFWECQDTAIRKIHTFSFLVSPDIKADRGIIHISGNNENGRVKSYNWNGSQLTLEFEKTIDGLTCSPLKFTEHLGNLLLHGLMFDGFIWSPHITASISGGSALIPFASFGSTSTGLIYFYGTGADGALDIYKSSGYATTGNLITGLFNADKPAIDKLFYSVELNFKALAADESIEVQYSIDNESTWISIGTASSVGDEKLRFLFSNLNARQVQLKIIENGNGTTTPTLYEMIVRYLPMADERYQWTLTLKCIEEMLLLDNKTQESKMGIELRNLLLIAKETKSEVDFEDIDYFETALNGTINNAITVITVDSTASAPERGRFRVDNEWITYTGKSATTFTGCTRGARGTLAASHLDDATLSNLYKVLVRSYEEIIPVMNKAKAEEMYIGVKMEET